MAGTTGYDFAARVNGLFFDPAGEAPLSQLWARFLGEREGFAEVAHHAKHAVMASALSTELARLTALAVRVGTRHRRYRDYTRADLSEALEELIACLEVYRTYAGPARASSRRRSPGVQRRHRRGRQAPGGPRHLSLRPKLRRVWGWI